MKSATSRKVRRCAVLIDHTVSDLVYYFDKTCPIRKLNETMGVKEDYYLASLFRKIVNNAKYALAKLGFDPERRDATDRIFGCKKGE